MKSARSQPVTAQTSLANAGSEPSAPVRVQLSRAKGWRMPPNTVKVDRSTKWGNPFVVSHPCPGQWDVCRYRPYQCIGGGITSETRALEVAVAAYRDHVAQTPVGDLRGKNLACWCKLGAPCHADVLLDLANASPVAGTTARSVQPREEPPPSSNTGGTQP